LGQNNDKSGSTNPNGSTACLVIMDAAITHDQCIGKILYHGKETTEKTASSAWPPNNAPLSGNQRICIFAGASTPQGMPPYGTDSSRRTFSHHRSGLRAPVLLDSENDRCEADF
jgi:hypothetical protein